MGNLIWSKKQRSDQEENTPVSLCQTEYGIEGLLDRSFAPSCSHGQSSIDGSVRSPSLCSLRD